MILSLLPISLSAIQPSVPMTINDSELGTVEQFSTRGPARLCMNYFEVDLVEGENGYLQYAGIHSGRLLITGPGASFEVSLGSGDDLQLANEDPVMAGNGWEIKLSGSRQEPKFQISSNHDDSIEPSILGVVTPLDSNSFGANVDFLRRISISFDDQENCDRRYTFGWDTISGSEPLSEERTSERSADGEVLYSYYWLSSGQE